jgi:hypothetical protein
MDGTVFAILMYLLLVIGAVTGDDRDQAFFVFFIGLASIVFTIHHATISYGI